MPTPEAVERVANSLGLSSEFQQAKEVMLNRLCQRSAVFAEGVKSRMVMTALERDGFAIRLTEALPEFRHFTQYDHIYVSNDAAGIEKARQILKHGTGVI